MTSEYLAIGAKFLEFKRKKDWNLAAMIQIARIFSRCKKSISFRYGTLGLHVSMRKWRIVFGMFTTAWQNAHIASNRTSGTAELKSVCKFFPIFFGHVPSIHYRSIVHHLGSLCTLLPPAKVHPLSSERMVQTFSIPRRWPSVLCGLKLFFVLAEQNERRDVAVDCANDYLSSQKRIEMLPLI